MVLIMELQIFIYLLSKENLKVPILVNIDAVLDYDCIQDQIHKYA